MPARAIVVAIALTAALVLIAVLAATRDSATVVGSCAPRGGGGSGASQLRFVDARDDHVTFTFGQSAGGSFDTPRYRVEQIAAAPARRTFRVRVGGSSTVNPDGTPSLEGLSLLQLDDRVLREVRLEADRDGTSVWTVTIAGAVCPRLGEKRFAVGSFPRVQIVLSFGNASSITLEPNPPLGSQVWVSGTGFAPSSPVRIAIGDGIVATTTATREGTFERGLYVYDLDPGLYRISASDARGHRASNQLVVPRQALVPDLVPRR